jgi:hypothetical protein
VDRRRKATEDTGESDDNSDDNDFDDDNVFDDDDNTEIPETQFGCDEWVNAGDDADEVGDVDDTEADNTDVLIVDEREDQIRKKVQMKIKPMDRVAATTDFYNNEIAKLRRQNVVALGKLKRDREMHSNVFLKKKVYKRLVEMEQKGIVEHDKLEESQTLRGSRYWKQHLAL